MIAPRRQSNAIKLLSTDLRHGAAVGSGCARLAHFEVDFGFLRHECADLLAQFSEGNAGAKASTQVSLFGRFR
jgi:hypothetical protein